MGCVAPGEEEEVSCDKGHRFQMHTYKHFIRVTFCIMFET